MDQQTLQQKITLFSKQNRKTLNSLCSYVKNQHVKLKKQCKQEHLNWSQEYEELASLCEESRREGKRLQQDIYQKDLEIEELKLKNNFVKSKIKLQNQEVSQIKDKTSNYEQTKKRDNKIIQQNEDVKVQIMDIKKEIRQLQRTLQKKQKQKQQSKIKTRNLRETLKSIEKEKKQKQTQITSQIEELRNEFLRIKNDSEELRRLSQKDQMQNTNKYQKMKTLDYIHGLIKEYKKSHD